MRACIVSREIVEPSKTVHGNVGHANKAEAEPREEPRAALYGLRVLDMVDFWESLAERYRATWVEELCSALGVTRPAGDSNRGNGVMGSVLVL